MEQFTPETTTWDRFVAAHPAGHLLQQSAWGRLKGDFGWEAVRVAIGAAEQIQAGAQLLIQRRYGFAAVYCPRGPLLSGDRAIDDRLLEALVGVARRARAIFLRIEPDLVEATPEAGAFHSWAIGRGLIASEPIQPRSTIRLDLHSEPEALFAQFSKGHRADIRRAERQGVHVRHGTPADLGAFEAIMAATSSRAGFAIHSPAYYHAAMEYHGAGSALLLAELHGEPVATHLVFAGARSGLYLYGGAVEAGLKSGANHLLQWHALRWAQAQGCAQYDFWGIPDQLGEAAASSTPEQQQALEAAAQADPLIGVYRFKKGFGGTITRLLPAYDRVLIAPLYRLWRTRSL